MFSELESLQFPSITLSLRWGLICQRTFFNVHFILQPGVLCMPCAWEKVCVLQFTCYSMLVGSTIGVETFSVLTKCLSGRYASWILESWPSLCWPLSQRDSPHLWERIVPVSFSQLQWVFTGAPCECPGLPFPSPVKAFIAGGDGDRGTSGLAPPAVSAHPIHQHHGRLPGVCQSCLWAPSGVCKEKACSSVWPPHCLCPLQASSWVLLALSCMTSCQSPSWARPWAWMPPVQLNISSPVGAVSGIALWAQHSTWLKRSHGLAICATFFVFVLMLPTKVHLVKAMVFPVVTSGCESWTIKKAECPRINAFELWSCRRFLRVPWTARRSNQSILKKIIPEYSFEGLMLKLKLQYFGHLMRRMTHLKRPWCWERLKMGGEREDRGWDGWMASPTQSTWVWVNFRSWWWTGRPGELQSMGSQRVGLDSVTELTDWQFSKFDENCKLANQEL